MERVQGANAVDIVVEWDNNSSGDTFSDMRLQTLSRYFGCRRCPDISVQCLQNSAPSLDNVTQMWYRPSQGVTLKAPLATQIVPQKSSGPGDKNKEDRDRV